MTETTMDKQTFLRFCATAFQGNWFSYCQVRECMTICGVANFHDVWADSQYVFEIRPSETRGFLYRVKPIFKKRGVR